MQRTTDALIETLIQTRPYALTQSEKREILLQRMQDLTKFHYHHCRAYQDIIDRVFGGERAFSFTRVEDAPFLPVSLFKTLQLKSIPDESVIKTLTSSGTTGQQVSRIYLDSDTAKLQSKVLVKLTQHFLGKDRIPMVILDHKSVIKNRRSYSARGAGILGMAQFGRAPFYALDDDMKLDVDGLLAYLDKHQDKPIFFFGFTFMVWKYFIQVLKEKEITLHPKNATLIHSGGWKKLQAEAVDNARFQEIVKQVTGMEQIVNFYGMVEQVGSVFFENPLHYLHAPIFSDVIIRDPITLQPLPMGEKGLVQVVSALPTSYPGHSILTEDLGILHGEDHEELEMKGRYFEILGRVPKTEVRGCSDTFQSSTPKKPAAAA